MRDIEYEIDREDRIRSVNVSWSVFAEENGAEKLVDAVVGTSIWDWVAGEEVRHIYQLLFAKIRKASESARFPFRCDSPGVRRFMELEISALPDEGLRCSSRLKRAERRRPVLLLDSRAPRSQDLLAICSWCKRVRVDRDLWLEIEQATSELRLLEDPPPGITHTICSHCEAMFGTFE